MIHYFLQVVLFQLLFLVVYDLFLKKETFFNYNRLYLLVTSVLGFVIPFIKLDVLQQQIPQDFLLRKSPCVFTLWEFLLLRYCLL